MHELNILRQAIQIAGDAILALQQKGFSVAKKNNHEIVTEADLLANEILKKELLSAFPQDGWLSEESADDHSRLNQKRVWVIDPIDGTIEYANGIPEYAVSVALIENGNPIVSAVYNPAKNELFYAAKNKGAWLNGAPIICNSSPQPILFLASRSEYIRGEWDFFAKHHQVKPVGSIAYKLALVAAGCAHATFSLGPKHEWDIAAGVLLVAEAGGVVTNKNQQPFLFNQKEVLVDGIIASGSDVINREVLGLVGQIL